MRAKMLRFSRTSLLPYASVVRGMCSSVQPIGCRWSSLANIYPPRHDHGLFLERSSDGQHALLAIGGSFGFDVASRWDIWRLRQGAKSWMGPLKIKGGDSVSARAGFGAAMLEGEGGEKVFIGVNGYDSSDTGGGNVPNDAMLVVTGDDGIAQSNDGSSFVLRPGGCAPRSGATLTTIDGEQSALLFGGFGDAGSLSDVHKVSLGRGNLAATSLNSREVELVPDEGPEPRCAHAAAPLGDGLIMFGGYSSTNGPMNDLWVLRGDTATGSTAMQWIQVSGVTGSAPSPRSGHSFTAIGDQPHKYVCFGGVGTDGEGFADVHVYDAERRHWQAVANIGGVAPTARYNHRAVFGEWGGESSLLITGGFTCDDGFGLGRAVGGCFALQGLLPSPANAL